MKKILGLFIFIGLLVTASSGQTINTVKLFRNLPLDKSTEELNIILHNDSSNYKQQLDKKGNPYYIATTHSDTFFYLHPLIINIQTHDKEIHLNITLPIKKSIANPAELTYNAILSLIKNDYPTFKEEIDKQENRIIRTTANFFDKKNDTKPKLCINWFREKKAWHEFIIIYKTD